MSLPPTCHPTQTSSCPISGHEKNPIHYFCLDELCFNKRLFCHLCAKIDHRKHRIGRIDRLIEPLSLLNINSFHQDSQDIYQALKVKIEEFYQVLTHLQTAFDKTVKEIQRTTFFQINCILETFSQAKIEEVEDLFLSDANEEEIKQSISMINFLQFQGVEDCNTVKNVCDITLSKMTKTVDKTFLKIQQIFQKMTKNIKDNDFLCQLKKYKVNLQTQAQKNLHLLHPQQPSTSLKSCLQQDKFQQAQTLQQILTPSKVKKQHIQTKQVKQPKETKSSCFPSSTIRHPSQDFYYGNKFNAYFQEEKIKARKERNVVIVKKEG